MASIKEHDEFQNEVMKIIPARGYMSLPSGADSTYDEFIVSIEDKYTILSIIDFKIEKRNKKKRDPRTIVTPSQIDALRLWGERLIFVIKTADIPHLYIILRTKAFYELSRFWIGSNTEGFTINFSGKWYENPSLEEVKDYYFICNSLQDLIDTLVKFFKNTKRFETLPHSLKH